jgi:hypothetical protein
MGKNIKMAEVSPFLSVIILNLNRLNSSQKAENGRMDKKKNDPNICFIQETLWFQKSICFKDTNRLKVKGWEKIFQAKNPK